MNVIVTISCGVRRARGQYILPSNMDLLYSEELMACIATKSLKEDERYRIDLCAVNRNIIQCDTPYVISTTEWDKGYGRN